MSGTGSGFRVQGSAFVRVLGARFAVRGSTFRVQHRRTQNAELQNLELQTPNAEPRTLNLER